MKLKIKVTKAILEASKMCGTNDILNPSQNCAIALAVKDIFPNSAVAHEEIYFYFAAGKSPILVALPNEARQFIWTFDALRSEPNRRATLSELEFEIDLPGEIVDHININDIAKSETLELVEDRVKLDMSSSLIEAV